MLLEHKPVRGGREMIDLLAVEKPKPKPAKIRAVSYEAAIDQLFSNGHHVLLHAAYCSVSGITDRLLGRAELDDRMRIVHGWLRDRVKD
jgi:hypothetical protein